jgi:VanZ family protein
MEYLQAFIPGRVPSVLDFGLNVLGTFVGAQLSARLASWRGPGLDGILAPEPRARVGVMAFGTWAAAQLFPFVPSADIGYLRTDLRPFARVLRGEASFSWTDAAIYALSALCLSSILGESLSPRRKLRRLVPLLLLGILLAKIPIVTRELCLEAFLGAAFGLAVSRWVGPSGLNLSVRWGPTPSASRSATRFARATLGGVAPFLAAAGAFVLQELRADAMAPTLSPMNWIPLRVHLTDERIGAADILRGAWPFVALAFVASGWRWLSARGAVFGGGGLVFLFALALEWIQSYLPGRYPDVTDALLALGAWVVAWYEISTRRTSRPRTSPSPPP